MWTPQNAKDSYWQKLKTPFFGLVIQDHIEFIGKANTIKMG
jgi:hypothetical protein